VASSDWTDGRYLRQRRNLNAISIALIVYVLGVGSVKGGAQAQLPGSLMTISLERPTVVIALAWASLLYFMWRYWLASTELRDQIRKKRQNAYHWTPFVRRAIESTIEKYDLLKNVAHGSVEYRTGCWVLKFGQVQKNSDKTLVNIPDYRLPLIPFLFISWLAEIKAAWTAPEFSEYYTPFFLAWFAIVASFVFPVIS